MRLAKVTGMIEDVSKIRADAAMITRLGELLSALKPETAIAEQAVDACYVVTLTARRELETAAIDG